MNVSRRFAATLVAAACLLSGRGAAQVTHDGSHDFDAEFGSWHVTVRRLMNEPAGPPRWVRYAGTHVVRPLWGGRANIGVLEISGPAGHIEGMQLRLYDPATRVWRLSFASSTDGQLQPPITGTFHHGVGDFRQTTRVNGRTIITRALSTPLSATSYRDVISTSSDNGATWHASWIAVYTRA